MTCPSCLYYITATSISFVNDSNLGLMAQTEVVGIWQGDIVIKSAIEKMLKELKSNPDLIDDVLASLPQDMVTADRYGDKTITQLRKWFADIEVEVLLGLKFRYMEKPAIVALELGDENENEATIGDKNYEPLEDHPRKPGIKRAVESLHADASYTIAVFAHGEPEYMLFLQALVLFQLLRRKEDLFDARGYVVSKFSMGTAALIEPNTKEMIYFRAIKLTGKVRHGWPKKEGGLIESVPVDLQATPKPATPIFNLNDWEGRDMLSGQLARPIIAAVGGSDTVVVDNADNVVIDGGVVIP